MGANNRGEATNSQQAPGEARGATQRRQTQDRRARRSHAIAEHETVLEGYQEHHVADLILKELHAVARGDERWGAKFKVLKENIEHHIEEEERRMFPAARAVLSREALNDLGVRMKALRAELED